MITTNAIECDSLTEARRVLAKIHAQPEIALAVAQGRMARWASEDDLIRDDVTGKYYIQWDGPHVTRRTALKERVELAEKSGELTPPERDEDGNQTKEAEFQRRSRIGDQPIGR